MSNVLREQLTAAGLGIPPDWEIVTLGKLLAADRGVSVGVMYPGEHDPFGVPLIKSADLGEHRINRNPEFRISKTTHYEYRRTELEGGELLMTLVGDVGRCAVVPESMRGWNAARAVAVMRFANPPDAYFVRSCLMSRSIKHLIDAWSNTTVQQTLNLKELRQLPIPWPPEDVRRGIVGLLGAIDQKIEINRRTSETLEEMARALFKSWFVDFDPVRAKAEGRPPIGVDPSIAKIFPDTIDNSGDVPLPRGWRRVALGDVLELKRGYDLPNAERRPGRVPIVSSSGPSGLHDTSQVRGPGVVTGRYGTIGKVFLVWDDFWPLNTALYVRDFKGMDPLFALYILRELDFEKFSDKGAVPGINRNHVHMELVNIPPPRLQQHFADVVRPWLMLVRHNEAESATLAGLRDSLLPKLISGELRVREAERAVEAVA